MLLSSDRPQAFREYRVTPADAASVAADAVIAAKGSRAAGCAAWAVHLSHDRRRVVTVEAWPDTAAFDRAGHCGDIPGHRPDTALYTRVGTGGVDPTPVIDPDAGVITIDVFPVWGPVVGPVSAVNMRNGAAFNRQPGCISTTVLRGVTAGRIATYARWRTTEDFLAAFAAVGGMSVDSTDALNAAAARRTLGLIRPDYHTYDLLDADDGSAQ